MTVQSYLESRAAKAILSPDETSSINTSISTLSTRLGGYFTSPGDGLANRFLFGSATRGTILPRTIDKDSDIDYMIVFEKGGFNPQTYLDRLRRFVEKYYHSSDIYQSSPTLVLELNHIRFDLVPALSLSASAYIIPDGSGGWMQTNPGDFNLELERKNTADSYLFEKWICEQRYPTETTEAAYLFTIFDKLPATQTAQWRNDKILRAKEIVANIKAYEGYGLPQMAENEVHKLIPR